MLTRPKDLKTLPLTIVQRGYAIFEEILLRYQPKYLIVHGKAKEQLSGFSRAIQVRPWRSRVPVTGRMAVPVCRVPIPRPKSVHGIDMPSFLTVQGQESEFTELKRQLSVLLAEPPTDRYSWPQVLELPARQERLPFRFRISEEHMERVRYGFFPMALFANVVALGEVE